MGESPSLEVSKTRLAHPWLNRPGVGLGLRAEGQRPPDVSSNSYFWGLCNLTVQEIRYPAHAKPLSVCYVDQHWADFPSEYCTTQSQALDRSPLQFPLSTKADIQVKADGKTLWWGFQAETAPCSLLLVLVFTHGLSPSLVAASASPRNTLEKSH